MKSRAAQWAAALLPAMVGLVAGLAWFRVGSGGSPLVLQVAPPMIPIAVGVVFSAFAVVGLLLGNRAKVEANTQLQAQRERFGADRRRFVQRLDHELKNPLTVLRAGIINLRSATDATNRETALTTMNNQTARLVRLTTDLRKIADLESRELESAEVDLTPLLTEVEELIREKAGDSRSVVLSIPRAPWPLPTITGDWDLLFLAFYNLADNAFKYSRHGDTIEIRAREETDAVIVEIADTGIGISAEALPHVQEELYRAENARSIDGSGLGLPLVKAIIERHNGVLSLTGRLDEGTIVTVQLPR